MKILQKALLGVALGLAALHAAAQAFPSKPMRIVVPFVPGGATDALARAAAQEMSKTFGQPVVVENRPGAGGNIGTEMVAKSPPDGHTLLMAINTHAIGASLGKLPYDPIKDFQPISLFAVAPNVIAAHPSFPPNSVPEMVRYAKDNPGKVTYGSAGAGSGSHLAGVLFETLAGVKMTHVPYKGAGAAVTDLMGGQISISILVYSVVDPQIKGGKLKALAVTSAKRSPQAPSLPTVAEGGLKGYDVFSWFGLLAAAGTPKDVTAKLHAEVTRIARLPELKEKFASQGLDLVGNSPDEFGQFIKDDWVLWDKLIKSAGIKLD